MENPTFFVLHSDEDGTSISGPHTRDELLERLDNGEWGENPRFLNGIPESDGGYWMGADNMLLVIRGAIVIPRPVEIVRKFSV